MSFSNNGASDEHKEEVRPVLNRDDVERLLAGKGSPAQLNLTGYSLNRADLSNMDLSGAQMGGIDLTRANLSRTNLSGTNLSEANFFIANLHGAILRRANLSGAKLNPAELGETDLTEADLSGADLSSADLSTARLQGANFSGANLTDVYLTSRQKDQLLLSKVAVQGANTIRLVFGTGDEPEQAIYNPEPAPALDEASQSRLNLSCHFSLTNPTALQLGRVLEGLARLYSKVWMITEGRYNQLVDFTRNSDLPLEEAAELKITRFSSAEKGYELAFELAENYSRLAKALANAFATSNFQLQLEERADKLVEELEPGLELKFKKVLAQLLLPELTQLSRLPEFSVTL